MPDFLPVNVQAVDDKGNMLLDYAVPFSPGMTARQALELAFIINQTAANPDPFVFTLQYYGYSEASPYPGFLGYEVESIGEFQTGAAAYWELKFNGVVAATGADTTFPNPGGTLRWEYTDLTAPPAQISPRAQLVGDRRASRASG